MPTLSTRTLAALAFERGVSTSSTPSCPGPGSVRRRPTIDSQPQPTALRAREQMPSRARGLGRSAYAEAAQAHNPSEPPLRMIESARALGTSRVCPLRQTTV
jgi:hypothetical protein